MTDLFGYAGFCIWHDDTGWHAKRLLTGEEYDLENCSGRRDACEAVDALVDAWVRQAAASPPSVED